MHFWIDKRSQCAYTGRHRVPSSLSAGVGRSRGRVGVGARKGMSVPVHRFTVLDPPPRRIQRRNHGPPPVPAVHNRRQQDEPTLYVEIPVEPQLQTIAHIAAARSVTPDTLLRTAALGLHHSPVMAPHLKFGMLVSFALATVFLAGAKYYFDRQVSVVRESSGGGGGGGGEASVLCAAVAALAGVGCALSLCRAKHAPLPAIPPDRISSTAQRHLPQPPPQTTDEVSLRTLLHSEAPPTPLSPPSPPSPVRSEAPPPYHIAVLLPAAACPPAYQDIS